MARIASQITSLTTFIQAHMQENIKVPRHWPLCGEFTVTGEFPAQRASNEENVSIWWRHNGIDTVNGLMPNQQTNNGLANWRIGGSLNLNELTQFH